MLTSYNELGSIASSSIFWKSLDRIGLISFSNNANFFNHLGLEFSLGRFLTLNLMSLIDIGLFGLSIFFLVSFSHLCLSKTLPTSFKSWGAECFSGLPVYYKVSPF